MKKILAFGVFDFFHLGHLRVFKQCKAYADYLIVAVQHEDYILKFKPNARILYSTEQRVELIGSIQIVDEVIIYTEICPDFLEKVEFDILAFGEDQNGERFDASVKWCHEHNKQVVRLKRTPGICSSAIKTELKELK